MTQNPSNPTGYYSRIKFERFVSNGHSAFKTGEVALAKDWFNKALNLNPDDKEVALLLLQCRNEEILTPRAPTATPPSPALQKPPGRPKNVIATKKIKLPEASLEQGLQLLRNEEFNSAAEQLEAFAAKHPYHEEALQSLASCYRQTIRSYVIAKKSNSGDPELYHNKFAAAYKALTSCYYSLAVFYFQKKNISKGHVHYELLKKAVLHAPQDETQHLARIYFHLAQLMFACGDSPGALESASKAIELTYEYSEAHALMGKIYQNNHHYQQACSSYHEAAKEKFSLYRTEAANAYLEFAIHKIESFNDARVKSLLDQALSLNKYAESSYKHNIGCTYLRLSEQLEKKGDFSLASKYHKEAASYIPLSARQRFMLGDLYFAQKSYAEALKVYDGIIDSLNTGKDAESQDILKQGLIKLAQTHEALGDKKQSASYYEKIISLTPAAAAKSYAKVISCHKGKDFLNAAKHYQYAKHLCPFNELAHEGLVRLKAKHGVYEKSINAFKKAQQELIAERTLLNAKLSKEHALRKEKTSYKEPNPPSVYKTKEMEDFWQRSFDETK